VRERFVVCDGALVPWPQVAAARRARAAAAQSDLPAPMVIRDALDGVMNPCDGKRYDSKSAYYRAVKDAGCVIVGNEAGKMAEAAMPHPARSNVKAEEVAEAMQKVEAGYKPQVRDLDAQGRRKIDELCKMDELLND
jgi:hypothetical protein